mgnify:CR=1 FL=1|tara:strand:+ start:286 stop:1611 length:1326 start_codon:yes stop_codon:yes gene_type:complete
MPLYKGLNEITGGGLYKGTTEIENGLKNSAFFYENLSTISWVAPTGLGLTYGIPSPQSQIKDGGLAIDTVTFTITDPNANIQGTAVLAGLPPGITITSQTNTGAGLGNVITVTLDGLMPQDSYFNTLLTVSGITGSSNYNAEFLLCGGGGTNMGSAGGGVRTSWGSVSGGGVAAESPLALVAGQTYVITINNPTNYDNRTFYDSYYGYTQVSLGRQGGSVSIVGGAINKTAVGGASGIANTPSASTWAYFFNWENANGNSPGGGARSYSSNLSPKYYSGSAGEPGQNFSGGNSQGYNGAAVAGGGGAGGPGGNAIQTNSQGGAQLFGAAGTALANSITGSTYYYASGYGTGQQYANNYGSASLRTTNCNTGINGCNLTSQNGPANLGVVVLRMPTANFGSITGTQNIDYTITTTGNETILTIFGGNGSANGGVGQQLTYTA